jgi:multisubunit Na+/H+ antiporter MnhB subunit
LPAFSTPRLAAIIYKGDRLQPLRWKLLIIASLLAAVAGAGVCLAALYFLLDPARAPASSGWIAVATLLVPLAATTYATIFVYRHTARRRALQAVATTLLALLLTLAALLLGSILLGRPTPEFIPAPNTITSLTMSSQHK